MALRSTLLALALLSLPGTVRAEDPSVAPESVEQVVGVGRTLEDAKRDARGRALVILQGRLLAHTPPLTAWEPTLADVERWVQDSGRAGKSGNVEGVGYYDEWIVRVRFPGRDEMQRQDQRVLRVWLTWELFWATLGILALSLLFDAVRRAWQARPRMQRARSEPEA